VQDAVIGALSQFTGVDRDGIRASDSLVEDLGIDSIVAVKLLMNVEKALNTELPPDCEGNLVGLSTVGDLVERLTMLLSQTEPA
jgi:acyl carrier protein